MLPTVIPNVCVHFTYLVTLTYATSHIALHFKILRIKHNFTKFSA